MIHKATGKRSHLIVGSRSTALSARYSPSGRGRAGFGPGGAAASPRRRSPGSKQPGQPRRRHRAAGPAALGSFPNTRGQVWQPGTEPGAEPSCTISPPSPVRWDSPCGCSCCCYSAREATHVSGVLNFVIGWRSSWWAGGARRAGSTAGSQKPEQGQQLRPDSRGQTTRVWYQRVWVKLCSCSGSVLPCRISLLSK